MPLTVSGQRAARRWAVGCVALALLYAAGYTTNFRIVTHPSAHYSCHAWQSGHNLILDFGPARYRFLNQFADSRPSGSRLDIGRADVATFDAGPDIRWGLIHFYVPARGFASVQRQIAPGIACTCRQSEDIADLDILSHQIRLTDHGNVTAVDGVVFVLQTGNVVVIDRDGGVRLDYGPPTTNMPDMLN